MKLLCLFLALGLALGGHTAKWGYEGVNGVNSWSKLSSNCAGSRQSPINIPPNTDLKYNAFPDFTLTGYSSMTAGDLEVYNNGHTVQVSIKDSAMGKTYATGGGLDGKYVALQLHFHWGKTDMAGSEHTFRGTAYPLEVHVVHYKESYGDVPTAVNNANGDGLAVLGFFFTLSDKNNTKMDSLINAMKQSAMYKGGKGDITVDFTDMMPTEMTEFYRYNGSLTTPDCNEAVVWTVFENKIGISAYQMSQFRTLFETEATETNNPHRMLINYRPTQDVNTRTVYKNYDYAVPKSFHWGYRHHEGPAYWGDYYDTCNLDRQSPVNLPQVDDDKKLVYDDQLESLQFTNYHKPITGTLKNNGHNIQMDIDNSDIYLEKGGLTGRYRAAQFHFHWGPKNAHGSEHVVDNKAYPMEMHIVHYKEDYGSVTGALGHPDGLAVLGVFIKAGSGNGHYNDIVSTLPDVKFAGEKKFLNNTKSLMDLIVRDLKTNSTNGMHVPFYRYQGSLTTPPCSQVVTWNVLTVAIPISDDQIKAFRKVALVAGNAGTTLAATDYMTENFRPPQDIGSRRISISYEPYVAAGSELRHSIVLIYTSLILFVTKLV